MSDVIYTTPNGLFTVTKEYDDEAVQEIYIVTSVKYGVKEHKSTVLLDALTTSNFLDKKLLEFFSKSGAKGDYDDLLDNLLHISTDEDIH